MPDSLSARFLVNAIAITNLARRPTFECDGRVRLYAIEVGTLSMCRQRESTQEWAALHPFYARCLVAGLWEDSPRIIIYKDLPIITSRERAWLHLKSIDRHLLNRYSGSELAVLI
jgi:hypothetical protein